MDRTVPRSASIDHLQDGESNVVLVANQSNVLAHSVDVGVCYVDPVHDSEDEQHGQDGDDLDIDLPHQRRLVDVRVHLLSGGFSIAELGEPLVSGRSRGAQGGW